MKTNDSVPSCPKCGAPVPSDAPQGLCPRCVLAGAASATQSGSSPRPAEDAPSLSSVVAAFPQLDSLELIGRGGMGFVYKARQTHLDRLIALKLLPEKLARDSLFTERFNREGRVLAKLSHPNIVSVFDFGKTAGFYFLAMEYVDGVNMRQAMQAGRFSPSEALAIVPRICEALQYAHEQGVLHRDIKPENILLDSKGRVKIADFGIAKLVGENPASATLTGTGSALGTPHYMAPEQLEKPNQVDHRADIYSLGVVFYEMLTGELPIGRFAPPSHKTPLDERVDQIVLRALEKEKELRQQSANEFKTQVENVSAKLPTAPLTPSVPSTPLAALAISIPAPIQRVLLAGLILWSGLMAGQLVPGIGGTGRWLAQTVRTGILASLFAGVGVIGIIWLSLKAWQKRELLLAPLGLSADLSVEPSDSGARSWNGWLRLVLAGGVGCVSLNLLLDLLGNVFILSQAIHNYAFRGSAFNQCAYMTLELFITLMTLVLPAVMVRRELHRPDLIPPAPAPAWMLRFTFLLFALGIISYVASIIQQANSTGIDVVEVAVSLSSRCYMFALLSVVALLTRSRIWRAIAISVNAWSLLLGLAGQGFYFYSIVKVFSPTATGQLPEGWNAPYISGSSIIVLVGVLMLASLAGSLSGLIAMILPSVRMAFGLAPRNSTGNHGTGRLNRWLPLGAGGVALATIGLALVLRWPNGSKQANMNAVASEQPAASDALTQKQNIEIRLAHERLDVARKQAEAGAVSPLDVAKAERDVTVAEARGKAETIAQANLQYNERNLESAQKQFQAGKLTHLELSTIESERDLAKIELASLTKHKDEGARPPANGSSTHAAGAVRLKLARLKLQEVENKIKVGLLPRLGREALVARRDVALAEAASKGDTIAEARMRLEFATQLKKLTEKLREVGKATPEELAQATQEEAQARTILDGMEK